MSDYTFFLGTNNPAWLKRTTAPLFISRNRLKVYRTTPRALGPWALDSGGFTEIGKFGGWRTTPGEYIDEVRRWSRQSGNLRWAAPQDWMCEPMMTAKTGLSVLEHQRRTVSNLLTLEMLAPELPWIPVLQGWELDDYRVCVDMYETSGIRLATYPTVGLGSVCRRQDTNQIAEIVGYLHSLGLKLHGFGVKKQGILKYSRLMRSSDSMSWSYYARNRDYRLTSRCTHRKCNNCMEWALTWRQDVLTKLKEKGIDAE